MHHDGRGLYLMIRHAKAASWGLRYQLHGKAHVQGLGSAFTFTLEQARQRAQAKRQLLADGIDPLAAKRSEQAALRAAFAKKLTFKDACTKYAAQHDVEWTSAKHAAEYLDSLRRYAWPIIGAMDVSEITVPDVLRVLEQQVTGTKRYPGGVFWRVRTRTADLANEIRIPRLLIEARALSDSGRHDFALDVISGIEGRESLRLRSDARVPVRTLRFGARRASHSGLLATVSAPRCTRLPLRRAQCDPWGEGAPNNMEVPWAAAPNFVAKTSLTV